MLTKSILGNAYDRSGTPAAADALDATRLTAAPAANTPLYDRDEVQARRLRRQRRQERAATRSLGGWTVRMW